MCSRGRFCLWKKRLRLLFFIQKSKNFLSRKYKHAKRKTGANRFIAPFFEFNEIVCRLFQSSFAPQFGQNLSLALTSFLQVGQVLLSAAPHSEQNLFLSEFSAPQFGHFFVLSSAGFPSETTFFTVGATSSIASFKTGTPSFWSSA